MKQKGSWKSFEDGWVSKGKHKRGGENRPTFNSKVRKPKHGEGKLDEELQKDAAFTKTSHFELISTQYHSLHYIAASCSYMMLKLKFCIVKIKEAVLLTMELLGIH